MALTAGVVSLVSVSSNSAQIIATAATGGTGSVTYQWYGSNVSGFTPGSGNLLAGQNALSLSQSSLIPSSTYYYVLKATDTVPTTVLYAQFTVSTQGATQSQNQFSQAPFVGMIDQRVGPSNVMPCMVDVSQVGAMYPGSPVKLMPSSSTIPKVVQATAVDDVIYGFIAYNIKSQAFFPTNPVEVAQGQSLMWLYASEAMNAGDQVVADVSVVGGVRKKYSGSNVMIVGYALDQATGSGQLIRVALTAPSYTIVP